jgi:hypothetical protein
MEPTIEDFARAVIEYFEHHGLDAEGEMIYLQAEKILGDIVVTSNI